MFRIARIAALLLLTVGGTSFLIYKTYLIMRDVEYVAHRAQVAASADDMLKYTKQMQTGLERHGMTSGHAALIFKTPANNLGLLNESVTQIVQRLEAVKGLDRKETAYQVALDDLRGTIRELEAPTYRFVWVSYWWLILLTGLSWLALLFRFLLFVDTGR